jgi:hypothetical protein
MTARVLPGTRVRMGALDCEVLSTVRCRDVHLANLDCAGERISDVPVALLTIVAGPRDIPKHRLEGLA